MSDWSELDDIRLRAAQAALAEIRRVAHERGGAALEEKTLHSLRNGGVVAGAPDDGPARRTLEHLAAEVVGEAWRVPDGGVTGAACAGCGRELKADARGWSDGRLCGTCRSRASRGRKP